MRIHGVHLRGLSKPAGDHPLGLDPGYTVVRLADAAQARGFVELVQALLYPSSDGLAGRDTRGRAVLSLALRSDAYVIAADFARRRVSLGRQDAKDGGYTALSSDPREIEEYGLAVGLPPAADFRRLQTCGMTGARGDELLPMRRFRPPKPAPVLVRKREAEERAAEAHAAEQRLHEQRRAERAAERARLLADHEQKVLALAHERARLEATLEKALAAARSGRVKTEERITRLRESESELTALEREHKTTLAELDKNAALADVVEDFDARAAHFRNLSATRDVERQAIDDTRAEVLAERARLRGAPRRQLVPIALGLALGAAGAGAGAVGYPIGYALAGLGMLALVGALIMARAARHQLGRTEALLAALRVRERGSERRFETEGAQIRGLLISLGLDSLDALSAAASHYAELLERSEVQKRRLDELAARHPPAARDELGSLERERGQADAVAAVRAARDALLALPAEIPLPELPPELPPALALVPEPTPADTAVDFPDPDDPLDDPGEETPREPLVVPRPSDAGPGALVEAAARVLGRREPEVRARLAPVLPVYLRALTAGTFTNARRSDDGGWVLRGAARDEQPWSALPEAEQGLVCLALQLALLEAHAAERRVPLLVGPELPIRTDSDARALARALKRLSAVVQVVQAVAGESPAGELAGKHLSLE